MASSSRPAASLRQRAIDSLVLAHLSASAYEYTASVFTPEASLSDGPLAPSEICSVLGLPTGSASASNGGSPLVTALTAASRQAAQPPAPGVQSPDGHMSALALRASLETQLKQVDAQAAVARSEAASASPTLALQQHMLTYQREADEAASKQLQAEVTRLRESEGARIRTEERAAARAELDRVLQEQQTWHAKQVAAMRRQEIEAREALRKREADFEAKAYEQRQRLLSEAERLRAREALLAMETEARANELKAQAEMLATQKAVLERDMTSVRRAREVELQAAQAELAAAGRELRITHHQRLLEVARQQGELEEQLSLAHAERDRSAGEVPRARPAGASRSRRVPPIATNRHLIAI